MKELLISAGVALVLTTGFAAAESQLGADQTVYAPQSVASEATFGVSFSFDGFSNFEESALPSVEEGNDAGFAGPR
ncbi:MAG: hypothetical protein ABJN04_12190 [Hyphomicrobiales bacterium]